MNPDQLIEKIFEFQGENSADLSIDVQDDSLFVSVTQNGWGLENPLSPPVAGRTIQEALTLYLQALEQGVIGPQESIIPGYLSDIFDLEAAVLTQDRTRFEDTVERMRKTFE